MADLKAIIDEIDIEDVEIEADAAGLAMVESAREFGMTPGKYNLITKLLGETVNVDNMEAYQEEAVKDLMGRFTATKGSIGKETAASAKQNAPDVTLPAQADAGKENSDQKASETVANATQKASEARPGVTQSLPANVTLPTVPPVVVPQPPVIVPTEPAVVGTVPPTIVPVEPDLPSVPSISIPRP